MIAEDERDTVIRDRDVFLNALSHELRTPLQAMLGWTRLLASGRLDPEQTRHGLEIIARNVKQQTRAIENLMGASRTDRGDGPGEPEATAPDPGRRAQWRGEQATGPGA